MRRHLLNQMIQADQAGATNPQQMIMRLVELQALDTRQSGQNLIATRTNKQAQFYPAPGVPPSITSMTLPGRGMQEPPATGTGMPLMSPQGGMVGLMQQMGAGGPNGPPPGMNGAPTVMQPPAGMMPPNLPA